MIGVHDMNKVINILYADFRIETWSPNYWAKLI